MNVVLVNPAPEVLTQKWDQPGFPCLSLAYLAATLRRNGVGVKVIDGKFEGLPLSRIVSRLAELDAPVFGLTAMTHEIVDAAKIASHIKAVHPAATVAVGGCHVTALPEQTLREFPAFDLAVVGEGEYSFLEVVRALDAGSSLQGISGIAYRENGDVRRNAPRPYIADLDELPEPAWDLFPRAKTYPVMTTRGCPFQCVFCMRVQGNKLRLRTPEKVVDEIGRLISDYGAQEIIFYDETFTLKKDRIHHILDLIIERGYNRRIKWVAQTRVNECDEALLAKMARAGCWEIDLGIESGNAEMLKRIGKQITLDDARQAVRLAKKVGIRAATLFILGHPHETKKTAMDTIDFAVELNGARLSLGIMVPYPGTAVAQMAAKGEGGYRLLSQDWSDFNKYLGNALELEGLTRAELERLQAWGYVKFYLWNLRLHDLLGLVYGRRREALAAAKRLFAKLAHA